MHGHPSTTVRTNSASEHIIYRIVCYGRRNIGKQSACCRRTAEMSPSIRHVRKCDSRRLIYTAELQVLGGEVYVDPLSPHRTTDINTTRYNGCQSCGGCIELLSTSRRSAPPVRACIASFACTSARRLAAPSRDKNCCPRTAYNSFDGCREQSTTTHYGTKLLIVHTCCLLPRSP